MARPEQADEGQLAPWNFPDGVLFPCGEHHNPGHEQHYTRADGGAQVGFHAGNSDFPQDGCETCKQGGACGIEANDHPGPAGRMR